MRSRILSCCLFAASLLNAQQGPPVNQVNFQAGSPPPVTIGTAQLQGNAGNARYCYWVVANYPIGPATASPGFCINNAPNVLTGSAYVLITWSPLSNAVSYDILRTTTTTFPASGSCTCALITGTTSTTFADQGGSLASYTLGGTPAAQANITLDNQNYSLPQLVVSVPGIAPFPISNGTSAPGTTPPWLRWLGDGSGGAFNCSSTVAPGEYWYSSLTVANGNNCTVTSAGPLIFRVTGACTIAGTLSSNGTNSTAIGDFGAAGGGGGFGAVNGAAGNGITYGNASIVTAGGSAGTSGVAGGNGSAPLGPREQLFFSFPNGYPKGGGSGGAGGSSGGASGPGGGVIVLICGSINFTGTISASGANGGPGGANTGGGGGGGGGVIVMSALVYTANAGILAVSGGNGGAAGTGTSTAGGNGGLGVTKQFTID